MPKPWEAAFPHLGNWIHTSNATRSYNCIAWAAGDDTARWDPMPGNYWPRRLPRLSDLDTFVKLYEMTRGYERCADSLFDPYFEKIAIYIDRQGLVTHAARQLSSELWTSKLGDCEDITHETPESLRIGYGEPVCFMQRPIKVASAP